MTSLYLAKLAARRAYTRAQTTDSKAWQAWLAGERRVYVDHTQAALTDAWRVLRETNREWNNACEAAWAVSNA